MSAVVNSQALTEQEFAAIDTATGSAHGLPNRFYTSAEAAQLERDQVLARTWVCVGFASELAPASARPVDLLGLPLVLVKDKDDTMRVFHNVCWHRGHKLVPEACSFQGAIHCPYHSWTYGFDGALRGTPHIGGHGVHDTPEFDRATRPLMQVRSEVWMDLVFVNLSGDAATFADYIRPLEVRWSEFLGVDGLNEARVASNDERMELTLNCNWKLAVENYCESYHLPWVHPGLNSYSRIEDHYNIVAGDWGAGQGTKVFEFSERAGIELQRFSAWPEDKLKIAEYIALFPNVLLGLQNDHIFVMLLLPSTHARTLERVQLYYVGEQAVSEAKADARKTMVDGWREVFLEDVGVCEGMQQGRASTAFDGGAFSPALDNATHHFHRWVASRLHDL